MSRRLHSRPPARGLSPALAAARPASRPSRAQRHWTGLVVALALLAPGGTLALVGAAAPSGAAVIPPANTGALSQLPGAQGCIEESPSTVDDTCGKDTLDSGNGLDGARALAAWGGYVFVAGNGNGNVIVVLKAGPDGLKAVSCINSDGSGGCAKAAPLGEGNGGDIPSMAVSPDGEHVYVGTAGLVLVIAFNHSTGALSWADNAAGCVSQDGTDGGSGQCTKTPDGVTAYYNVVLSPSGDDLYNFGNGGNSSVVTYKVGGDGSLTPVGCLDSGACGGTSGKTDARGVLDLEEPNFAGLGGLALTSDGKVAYGVDPGTNTLWMFDVVPAGQPGAGSLALPDSSGTPGAADYCVQEGTSSGTCTHQGWGMKQLTGGVAVGGTSASPYVYVVDGGEDDPGSVLELDGATPTALGETGCASSSGTADGDPSKACAKQPGLADAGDVVESPDGKDLYVAAGDETSGQVVELAVDPATGALSPGACYSDDGAGGNGTAYAACTHFQGLFGIDAFADPNSAIAVSPAGARTVSPSGSEVYVAAGQDGSVADLARGKIPAGTVHALIGPPTHFTVTPADGDAELSWGPPVTGAAPTYKVLWREGTSGTITTKDFSTNSGIISGLNNATYEFSVEAVIAGQAGEATAWLSATPGSGLPPLPPTGLTTKVAEVQVSQDHQTYLAGEVQLKWVAPPTGSCSRGKCLLSGYDLKVYGPGVSSCTPGAGVHPRTAHQSISARAISTTVQLPLDFEVDTFELSSVNGYGESTCTVLPVTVELVPERPLVTATATGAGVDLSWTDNVAGDRAHFIGPVTGVDVSYGPGSTDVSASVPSVKWASTGLGPDEFYTAAVTGFPPGKTYYFTVAVSDAAGPSLISRAVAATIPAPPPAPTGLIAYRGNGLVTMSWQPPAQDGGLPITGYQVFMGTKAGGEAQAPIASPSANSLLIHGEPVKLDNGTTYYFTVTAVNSAGAGPASSEVSATPEPVLPGPQGLSAAATAAGGGIKLSWSGVSTSGSNALTGYDLFQSTSPTGPASHPTGVPASDTSYTVTGLTPGTVYYFDLTSVNSYGQGLPSDEASATPSTVVSAPGAPLNLVAQRGNNLVVLSWQAPSNNGGALVTQYQVYMGTSAGGEGAKPISTGNATSLLLRNPDPVSIHNGTTYYFTVKAVNVGGTGPASQEASATPAPVAGSPQGLAATADGTSVKLTWSAESGISGFDLYQGTAPGPVTTAPTSLSASATSDTVSGLTAGVTNYFYLTALNTAGQSLPSTEVSAVPVGAPSAPDLTVHPGYKLVELTWQEHQTGGSAITGYTVLWRKGTVGTVTLVHVTASDVAYSVTGLLDGQTYEFAIAATNAVGTGPAASWASAEPTRDGSPPPPAFTGFSTQPEGTQDGEVTVTWSEPPVSLTDYELTFDDTVTEPNSNGHGDHIEMMAKTVDIDPTKTSYTASLAMTGTYDTFYLVAYNTANGRTFASTASRVKVPLELLPGAPGPVAVAGVHDVKLQWEVNVGATTADGIGAIADFHVFQGTKSGQEATTPVAASLVTTEITPAWSAAAQLGTDVRMDVTVKGLTAGTTYYFTVAQGDAAGFGPASQEVSATATG